MQAVERIFLKDFRADNQISQQELAVFLGTNRSFVSLIELGKNKLPNDKIDKIMFEGVLEHDWNISKLNPTFDRLCEVIKYYADINTITDCPYFNINTGENVMKIPAEFFLKVKHGKIGITEDIEFFIHDIVPEVNTVWLEYGTGSMFEYPTSSIESVMNSNVYPNTVNSYMQTRRIMELEARIAKLEKILGVTK